MGEGSACFFTKEQTFTIELKNPAFSEENKLFSYCAFFRDNTGNVLLL